MTVRDSEAMGVAWRRRRGVDEKEREGERIDFRSDRLLYW